MSSELVLGKCLGSKLTIQRCVDMLRPLLCRKCLLINIWPGAQLAWTSDGALMGLWDGYQGRTIPIRQ